jgi:hypothetical protein
LLFLGFSSYFRGNPSSVAKVRAICNDYGLFLTEEIIAQKAA